MRPDTWIQQRLIESGITKEQLALALERQRIKGGHLGHNLTALGFVSKEEVSSLFSPVPGQPETIEETGLTEVFITELILKHGLDMGEFSFQDMAGATCLPPVIIDKCTTGLRRNHLVEVKGATQLSRFSYRFSLTAAGREKASRLKEMSRYTGPAPVPFNDYKHMVEMQTIKSIHVDENAIRNAFSDIVVNDAVISRIGPAVSSGKAIFLYGPSGNGKTTVAEAIGKLLPGEIYIPHAIIVYGEIITVFDNATHSPVENKEGKNFDQRWVRVKRPVVSIGGEMTLKGLDLDYNDIAKYYVGPLQLKANNGMFIIDEFGRQQIAPRALLNRWIVPLERRTDFLSFHTGMKIEIPFDQLMIFSTNLEPKSLVDEAFLRRIPYKIKIDHPDQGEYKKIFESVCRANNIAFSETVFRFLVKELYEKNQVRFTACHCRDLIDNIIDKAHFQGVPPELTQETITEAWNSYYVAL